MLVLQAARHLCICCSGLACLQVLQELPEPTRQPEAEAEAVVVEAQADKATFLGIKELAVHLETVAPGRHPQVVAVRLARQGLRARVVR